ncbi:hypothetical protein AOE01nite_10270 [Acetobacter oeni]|uniref:Uncharacterized protein n=1 Tax=Acetobacter oeni TaxID=304077 RepID=A0A511XIN2_9PROT|nr:hypothetical protein AA21952_0744 [Acetobacter oeni LMG 21952]GEN62803.1 hypothetical protein AOE01nite_10270 [Acetobacter oeni]
MIPVAIALLPPMTTGTDSTDSENRVEERSGTALNVAASAGQKDRTAPAPPAAATPVIKRRRDSALRSEKEYITITERIR